ncbi:unnamed protein product, partial [Sphacelaria rigidula]
SSVAEAAAAAAAAAAKKKAADALIAATAAAAATSAGAIADVDPAASGGRVVPEEAKGLRQQNSHDCPTGRNGEGDNVSITAEDGQKSEGSGASTMSSAVVDRPGIIVSCAVTAAPNSSSSNPPAHEHEQELDPTDPFAQSNKVARTPTGAAPSNTSSSIGAEHATIVAQPAAMLVTDSVAGGSSGQGDACGSSGPEPNAASDDAIGVEEALDEAACSKTPRSDGGSIDSGAVAASHDPFTSRSKLPRTPVESLSAGDEGSSRADVGANGANSSELEIGELHREIACMADRLAKQRDERNKLAEVAFEAQDEVATLRKKLEEHQHSSSAASSSTVTTAEHDTTTKGADDGDNVEVLTVADSLARGNGDPTQAAAGSASEVSPGGSSDARVIQLELEKRKCEEQREAAEREAQQAKLELEKTQAKVTELAAREQAMRLERAEERYRRAQAQCEEDMKWIEERKIKVEFLRVNGTAQILREKMLQEEQGRAQQLLREGAAALTTRAADVVKAYAARNRRMSTRVAALWAGVEESEQRVALLTTRSQALESAGHAARKEAIAVRAELELAQEALTAGKANADELAKRLGESGEECRRAQQAQEDLR